MKSKSSDRLKKPPGRAEGKKYIEEQHRLGKLTARERIDHLMDAGTFVEVNMLAQHQCTDFGMEKNRPWGDGVITGYGKVEGRVVFLYAQDSTVMGGSVGLVHGQKIASLIRMARQASAPMVGLIDSAGGRIQEGSGAYSLIFAENVESSGVIPQISAIMGNCAGGGVYSPAITDFIFMVDKTSQMFITGPLVIKEVTGQEVGSQELGGARVHSQISGVADFVGQNDLDCLAKVKKLLSYLPSSYTQKAPVIPPLDDPERCEEGSSGDPSRQRQESVRHAPPDFPDCRPRGVLRGQGRVCPQHGYRVCQDEWETGGDRGQ